MAVSTDFFGGGCRRIAHQIADAGGKDGGSSSTTSPSTSPSTGPGASGSAQTAVNYTVKVTATDLNIRSGPGINYGSKGAINPGVYTIVAEAGGTGASKWGKLKSGAGWISLDYTTKVS